ncbi:MAG: hypothetical protein AAFY47_11895, partial [Pseudomonadota bacterium]
SNKWRTRKMYDRQFFNSKLGQAALASVLAMTAMIALTSQFQASPSGFASTLELAVAVEMA